MNRFSLIGSILMLPLFLSLIQAPQETVNDLIFEKQKTCEYQVYPGTFFKNQDKFLQDKFFRSQLNSISVIAKCSGNRVRILNGDTTLFLGLTITTMSYRNSYASCAFDTLLYASKLPPKEAFSLWLFNKPGRIYGLNARKGTVTMIVVNSCADRPLFDKLVAAMRREKKYDKLFSIPCGADGRDVRTY